VDVTKFNLTLYLF